MQAGGFAARRRKIHEILDHRWVKIALKVWLIIASYDTALSQIIPASWSERSPKVREIVAMTSGWLPLWGWLLILAAILVAASSEYAYRHSSLDLNTTKRATSQGSRRKMIALVGMITCGLGFLGFAWLYFFYIPKLLASATDPALLPNVGPAPHTAMVHPVPSRTRQTDHNIAHELSSPEHKILLKQYGASDRARLDDALYAIFNVITVCAEPLRRDAEYNLVHNWEAKMASPQQGPAYFLAEIDRVRVEAAVCFKKIYDMIYKDYNYYMEELRDASVEVSASKIFGVLDDFKGVVQALPPNPSMVQLRVLVADKHRIFAQGIEEYGRWIGDVRTRVQMKREYILTLQGSP